MRSYSHWALPLALVGGAATLGVFALQARRNRLHHAGLLHKHQVDGWEGEGGNIEPVRSSDPLA
jgi:hypothetical protein